MEKKTTTSIKHQGACKTASSRPVLHYLGSKWTIAPWVISHFPEHIVYVEPFGGGANVLLRKEPSPLEIYNDLDSAVVNFWRVLREQPDALIARIKVTPWAREEYEKAWEAVADPIEAARRLFVRTWMSFSAATAKAGSWRCNSSKPKGSNIQWGDENRLLVIAQRLREVQIENNDALKVIRRFDSPNAMFYCDPPYVLSTRSSGTGYKHELSDDRHIELLELLNSVKGKVVLSCYHSDLYKKYLPAKRWVCYQRQARTRNPKNHSIEVLYIKK